MRSDYGISVRIPTHVMSSVVDYARATKLTQAGVLRVLLAHALQHPPEWLLQAVAQHEQEEQS